GDRNTACRTAASHRYAQRDLGEPDGRARLTRAETAAPVSDQERVLNDVFHVLPSKSQPIQVLGDPGRMLPKQRLRRNDLTVVHVHARRILHGKSTLTPRIVPSPAAG